MRATMQRWPLETSYSYCTLPALVDVPGELKTCSSELCRLKSFYDGNRKSKKVTTFHLLLVPFVWTTGFTQLLRHDALSRVSNTMNWSTGTASQ